MGAIGEPPTTPVPDPLEGFGVWQEEIERLKSRLAKDVSAEGAQAALHRLLALTAATNLALASGRAPGPPTAGPPGPAPFAGTPARRATADLTSDLTGRLEAIAASLHQLLVTIAARVGATGYSIGVSLPAGLSITVDFAVPKPAGPAVPGLGGPSPKA